MKYISQTTHKAYTNILRLLFRQLCVHTFISQRLCVLCSFSSYPFENKLYQIKNIIRSGNKPLAQIAKILSELSQVEYFVINDGFKDKLPILKNPLESSK